MTAHLDAKVSRIANRADVVAKPSPSSAFFHSVVTTPPLLSRLYIFITYINRAVDTMITTLTPTPAL
jgi:hypothetical protein